VPQHHQRPQRHARRAVPGPRRQREDLRRAALLAAAGAPGVRGAPPARGARGPGRGGPVAACYGAQGAPPAGA
jgi:hypothetical protein